MPKNRKELNAIAGRNELTSRVAVVGGGISGLSAAWYLQRSAPDLRIDLIEADDRWGGKIITRREDGFIVDGGPDTFVTRKPEVWDLAGELDLRSQVIDAGSETRDIHVMHAGRLYPIPLSPPAFLRSNLISLRGKLRMIAEPLIPARRDFEDESLSAFVDRRLGVEARQRFLAPVLAGIYNADPDRQSIMTTSPVMRSMEREHGGLFRGALARMLAAREQEAPDDSPPARFINFESGAQELVEALIENLHAQLHLNTAAVAIEKLNGKYRLALSDGSAITADGLILATPASVSAALLDDLAPAAAHLLSQIEFASIGTLALVYHPADLNFDFPIRGLMIPRREGRFIDAITWTTAKLPERTPGDGEMLRVFFGGARPETAEMTPAELLPLVRQELEQILGITAEPSRAFHFAWPYGYPQADVGHLELVEQIEAELPAGLFVTGSSFRGLAVPDCIKQSFQTVSTLIEQLRAKH
jgi:oxygen-dependent protoporphyrinogen oxidase